MRIHVICDHCGKGRYRRQRRFLDHQFCSPSCCQAFHKKWKNWKGTARPKTAYQKESEIDDFERNVRYTEERNKWINLVDI